MKNKEIQVALEQALEEEIPASTVDLWSSVRAELHAGNLQTKQKGNPMNRMTIRKQARPLALALALAILVITLATPAGRTFAQSILNLFTRTKSSTFPLTDTQVEAGQQVEDMATALPPAPLLSLTEAQHQVDFEIATLPTAPTGFQYLGIRLHGERVNVEYKALGGGGHLIIQQSSTGYDETNWESVPENAIVPVKIGELDGEFVQGTFVVYPDEDQATWNPDAAILRLRWVDNGVWFEIAKFGNVEAIEYLDQVEMIELAESLTTSP